mmetsp:Transcript_12111/g.34649  ORF Transcript_12111/g.34649 Transcript_12111/m.34649 type:complete len:1976 (+) Transcript_12111:150-6077(+)
MSSLGLPAGTFDDVADDAIWGSPAPSLAAEPKSEQRRVANTSRAFRDVDVDMAPARLITDDVVDDYDVDVNLAHKLSARPKINSKVLAATASTSANSRKELFLLGSTFKSNVTVDYVAVNLTHTLNMNPRVASKLAKKLKRNQGSIAISLGVMSHDKCDEMEKALKLRDIDCQSLQVAGSPTDDTSNVKKNVRNTSQRPPTAKASMAQPPPNASNPNNRGWFVGSSSVAGSVRSQSVAGSIPPPPTDDCSEARSHNTQTSTPRIGNVRKSFGFGGEHQHQHQHQQQSSNASMSSHTASSRKPNYVAAGAMARQHHNANNINFGDVTARSRTKGAGPPTASAPNPTSSAASAAAQQQSLIFSSGNYEGEKRFGKPHGKGTFKMPGQFSYTGDWARGNPVGSGHFTLAGGEIREGSWNGTNFIETRRYFPQKQKTPRNKVLASDKSIATEASKRSSGQFDVVVDHRSSSSKSTASPLEEPSLLPERNVGSSKEGFLTKESTVSGASSGGYPAECGPYMISLRAITKPSVRKSGSLAIHGETTVAIMSYDDVGSYEGEWQGGNVDGLPHGMGCFDFTDGTRYYGEFSNGTPSGDGRFTFKNGSVYSHCDHNGALSPNGVFLGTPATEASSQPSESNRAVDCSPLSTVTMSPVLSKAGKETEQLQNVACHKASADIDIPALNEDANENSSQLSLGEGPTSRKADEEVVADANELHELPSRILPYKRGPSIPNITSFTPTASENVETESEAKKDEVVDTATSETEEAEEAEEPLVFLDDGSTNSVQSPIRGGLDALLQEKMEEDPECVRHLIETPFVLKLDETRQEVIKYLDTAPGKTTSASYVYSEIGTYNGEFCDGYPHGVGTFFWIDGTTYSGNFAEGEPDGDGKLVLPSGEMFVRCAEGNDIIHLPAQQEKDDVSIAKSVDSNISAESVESGEAGKYKGQIVAGVPHGLGSMKFADGSKYTGQWRNGSPAKEGTFYFPNGERHYGRWNGSKFEPIKKQKGLPIKADSSIWNDEDLTESPLPTVQEEETGEQSCSTSVKSRTSSSVDSSPRSNNAHNESPRRLEKQDVELDEDSPRNNRVGGVTHLDTDSVGDMSGIESMIASIEMSAFSDIEDASVYSQLSGTSTPKKAANEKKKTKSKFSLTRPKKHGDANAGSLFDEKSASQSSVSQGEKSRNSFPIDTDDASFYSTDDDEVEDEKSRNSSLSSGSANPKQLRPSKTACLYYNGFTAECRHYLSSLRCIRHFSTKKSGSLQMDNGQSIAGVTYSGIGEYDGAWRGSMLKGVPHGHGQFSWGDGTRYVGDWNRGIPIGQDGHFVFLDGTVCNRGKGIVVVQALARSFLARQSLAKQQVKKLDDSATTIQTAWRAHDASHREERIAAAILIQEVYRPYSIAKFSAATRIQTAVRSSTARATFLEKRSSMILIQSQARRYAARASFLALARTCIVLQARLRGNVLRKKMEARYIDVDALDDDEDSVQVEEADPSQEESTEETEEQQQPSQLALAADAYPAECAAYFSSLDLSSVNRKGSLYWNENGKHASLTYTSEKAQYNGAWKGSLLDGKPHGNGKMKFSDRTKFYGSFVDGIPSSTGYFKLRNGDIIYSKRIGTIRQEITDDFLGVGDRLETELIVNEMYHSMSDMATRLQLEADDDAIARIHLDLAFLLEENFILTEQKKISAIEESLKQIEAELAAKRAAEVAALTALRRSMELQEAITRKRSATKIQAVVRGVQIRCHRRAVVAVVMIQSLTRGVAARRRAQLEADRRAMALDMLRAAMRCEEENALPQDSIVAAIKQVEGLEEERTSPSSSAPSPETMAARFLSDPNVKANPNTREKIAYLHRKGLPWQKIDEAIKKVYEDTKKAEAEAKKSAKVEYGRASSSDDSSDHQSRNTASTSASSGVTANAPSTPKKKRSFRPTSVAKKVRSALAGGKGNGGWTASAPRTMPISSNNVDDGESALASFAALQDALDSVISERKD